MAGMLNPAPGEVTKPAPLAAPNDAIIACALVRNAPWLTPLATLRNGVGEPCAPFVCGSCCACWLVCDCCCWAACCCACCAACCCCGWM